MRNDIENPSSTEPTRPEPAPPHRSALASAAIVVLVVGAVLTLMLAGVVAEYSSRLLSGPYTWGAASALIAGALMALGIIALRCAAALLVGSRRRRTLATVCGVLALACGLPTIVLAFALPGVVFFFGLLILATLVALAGAALAWLVPVAATPSGRPSVTASATATATE